MTKQLLCRLDTKHVDVTVKIDLDLVAEDVRDIKRADAEVTREQFETEARYNARHSRAKSAAPSTD